MKGYRKFAIAILVLIAATVLVAMKVIDPETWKWAVSIVTSFFFVANAVKGFSE